MNAPARVVTTPEKVRLRVEDFLLLDQSGAFAEFTKTELIDGEIYVVNAQHSRHARIKTLLAAELLFALRELGSDLEAWTEPSTRVSDYSLPEPDIVLTRWRGAGVVPLESVALVVEVADTTLSIDLGRKQRIYAQAKIAEYWVVDVEGERVIRLTDPAGESYAQRDEMALAGPIEAATVVGLRVVLRL